MNAVTSFFGDDEFVIDVDAAYAAWEATTGKLPGAMIDKQQAIMNWVMGYLEEQEANK